MPLIGTFPVAAEPACRANPAEPPCRANEAAGQTKTKKNAKAIFTEVFDIGSPALINWKRRKREADVGSRFPDTTKFYFRKNFGGHWRGKAFAPKG
jgi:hypothetical protein